MISLNKQVTYGFLLTLLGILFTAGGGWVTLKHVLPDKIQKVEKRIDDHRQREYRPLKQDVETLQIQVVPKSELEQFVTTDDLHTLREQNKKDLEALKELMREIQRNQNQRLDYIIKRLDNE